jgi:hypothetical protein
MQARLTTIEAALALIAMRIVVLAVPFSWWDRVVGQAGESSAEDGHRTPTPDVVARGVGRAIARAVPRLPFHSSCLVQALAARLMLARRRRPSTLVLGVKAENGAFRAHAWLLSGGGTVCGGLEAAGYQTIAALRPARDAWPPRADHVP